MMKIVMEEEAPPAELSFTKRMELPLSILCYSSCSVSMILINKLVIDTKGFSFPFVLIFFQNGAAAVLVLVLKALGVIDFPPLEWKLVKRWIPLTVLFVGMLVTSLLALKTMSVPLQTLIKSTAIVTTAIGDKMLFGHTFNKTMLVAFLMLSMGSIMGALKDTWLTPIGLFWSLSNVACTSSYQLYMKGVMNDLKGHMGRWGPVMYNNVLSIPPLIIPAVLQYNEWSVSLREKSQDSAFLTYMFVMVFLSASMTMASFWCMSATSPTTYGVIGGMNRIPLNILGIVIFDQMPSNLGIVGIVGSIMGGLLYTHAVNLDKSGASNLNLTLSPSVWLAQLKGGGRAKSETIVPYSLVEEEPKK